MSWGHPSRHSWTPVGVHRILRRDIMATGWTANLHVGGCRRWMGRTRAGTLRMLWAVRGGHGGPVDGIHMGRATKLTHRACRRLWRITLRLGRRGYGRRLILRSVGKTLLGTE